MQFYQHREQSSQPMQSPVHVQKQGHPALQQRQPAPSASPLQRLSPLMPLPRTQPSGTGSAGAIPERQFSNALIKVIGGSVQLPTGGNAFQKAALGSGGLWVGVSPGAGSAAGGSMALGVGGLPQGTPQSSFRPASSRPADLTATMHPSIVNKPLGPSSSLQLPVGGQLMENRGGPGASGGSFAVPPPSKLAASSATRQRSVAERSIPSQIEQPQIRMSAGSGGSGRPSLGLAQRSVVAGPGGGAQPAPSPKASPAMSNNFGCSAGAGAVANAVSGALGARAPYAPVQSPTGSGAMGAPQWTSTQCSTQQPMPQLWRRP